MPDAQTIVTVKATTPLLVKTGPKLTAHSYDRIFTHNPGLKEIFNVGSQRSGDRHGTLFNTITAYANNIENLVALLPAAKKIAQKHTSFQIKPEQCNIVGGHLLATLDGMFSPGQEVLDVWGKAYGILANVFINHGAQVYNGSANKNGGWEDTRPFRVVVKAPRSTLITGFEFEPVDGGAIAEYHPKQYLDVQLKPESFPHQEARWCSLTRRPDDKGYRIAVKREDGGQVSTWLRNHINVGDVVHLAAPAGDFFMDVATDTPVSLISAGVGQAPMLTILGALAKAEYTAQVSWFRATENGGAYAFADEVNGLSKTLPRFSVHTWYCEPTEVDRAKGASNSIGLIDSNKLESAIGDPAMQFYPYGPAGFMQFAVEWLVGLGVENENIHYERFDPHKVL